MLVKIYADEENKLTNKVSLILEELGLNEFIKVEETNDENIIKELNITKEPALIIEEESIDFRNVIFEWIIPENEELKSMFISIIWGDNSGSSCSPSACWGCSWGCGM